MAGAGAAGLILLDRPGAARADALPTLPAQAGGTVAGGVQQFVSRPDLQPPAITVTTPAGAPLGALVVTEGHGGASQPGPLLIDQTGRIIYFQPPPSIPPPPPSASQPPPAPAPSAPGASAPAPAAPAAAPPTSVQALAFNVRVQQYAGQPVLTYFQGVVTGGHGVGYGLGSYQILDTSYTPVATVNAQGGYQGDLHEFLLTSRGSAIFSCYGVASARVRHRHRVYTVPYLFGVIQEVDVASGKLLFQWRSDRHVALSESYKRPVVKPGWLWDYFHINSVAVDPKDGNLIVSGRNTWACYKVDRRTGKLLWRLGGKRSDFRMGPGTRFAFQHDVQPHPGGVLTLFNNEGGPPRRAPQSRAMVLVVQERKRRVRLRRAIRHVPPVYSDALGSVQALRPSGTFVGWGRAGYFTLYNSAGTVAFEGQIAPGVSSYRTFLEPWSATPTTLPALALTPAGSGATLYASWNGATALAQWVVLGGDSPGALAPLGSAPARSFETAITLGTVPAYVAVQAADASGRVLSTSPAIAS